MGRDAGLRALQQALATEADRDVELALRVAIMLTARRSRLEIAEVLGLDRRKLMEIIARLERVADRVDRDLELGFE